MNTCFGLHSLDSDEWTASASSSYDPEKDNLFKNF